MKIKIKKYLTYIFTVGIVAMSVISCEEIIFEENISDQQIILVAPKINAKLTFTGITFTWERLESVPLYQLQIAKPNFAEPLQVVLDTITANSSFTQQLPEGDYEWRVRAMNSSYKTQYTSRLFSIVSNDDFQSNTVILQSPANILITKNATQNLLWQEIIGAVNYQVQITDNNATIIKDQTLINPGLNFTFPEGNYTWRVRANNGTQQTLYTSRSILVDMTVPNTPVLSNPANASTTRNTDINFQWNRVPVSGSAETDSIYIYTDSALTIIQQKKQVNNPFNTTLESGNYYWYIKSFDQAGNIGIQSTVSSFIIE